MLYDRDANSVDVGSKLRQLREERNISMRSLATKSGLSANALSMIERGKTSPSVSTLYKLADALGIPITDFFGQQAEKQKMVFIKSTGRTHIPFMRGLLEGLGGDQFIGRVKPFLLTLETGATSGPHRISHTGHEFVFCLRGKLEYRVETQVFTLEAGDSLLFAANLRHSWRNYGDTVTNVLVVITDHAEADHGLEAHWEQTNPAEELNDAVDTDLK